MACILPELVSAYLVHEVNVVQPVAVDIGHRDAAAVIVVDGLVVDARIFDDVVNEGDAAFRLAIGEVEVVECADLRRRVNLSLASGVQCVDADVGGRRADFDAPLRRRRLAAGGGEHRGDH